MSKVELISLTPNAEKTMAYIARVSNPNNQKNEDYSKLLSYCIKHEHWSVFEQSFMTLQIETNRGIAAQILRHRSFTFQEFSQRYADSSQLGNIPLPELRRQDFKNRQNSIPDLPDEIKKRLKSNVVPPLISSGDSMLQTPRLSCWIDGHHIISFERTLFNRLFLT